MTLALGLGQELSAFLDHKKSVDDVHSWLVSHVQAVHDCGDEATQDLCDQVWGLIDAYAAGHRSEESIRAELLPVLRTHQPA